MKVEQTDLAGVLLITPDVYEDRRGYFMETFQLSRYRQCGVDVTFVQDNLSFSVRGTLRGLHFQHPYGQAKLVQVLQGEVFDVAVDIRVGSPAFGQWFGAVLSSENHRQLFIPAGFAHGFCVLSPQAVFSYKCSDFYNPDCERGILWNDPDIGIEWPLASPVLSHKDGSLPRLAELDDKLLPEYEKQQISKTG